MPASLYMYAPLHYYCIDSYTPYIFLITAYITQIHKPVGFEFSSNMHIYYAPDNHIFSFINDHLCIPCLADIFYIFFPLFM